MKKYFFTFLCFLCLVSAQAQTSKAKAKARPVDGYYKKTNVVQSRYTEYPPIKESDILFSRRLWQDIDVREKGNATFANPQSRLIDIMMDAIMAGELTAYDPTPRKEDPTGDAFSTVFTPQQAFAQFADSVLVPIFDTLGNQTAVVKKPGEFNPDSIIKFRIKEDWLFDKHRSTFEHRIIGIAPMVKKQAAGEYFEEQPAFWIYFPELRPILATKSAYTGYNDASGFSYDDVFMKRMFNGLVSKESNGSNLRVKDYAEGEERIRESDRIKKELAEWEKELWIPEKSKPDAKKSKKTKEKKS